MVSQSEVMERYCDAILSGERNKHKTASNFSFDDGELYSYTTCIARVVDWEKKLVAFNSDRYSQTSSQHQGGALRHLSKSTITVLAFSWLACRDAGIKPKDLKFENFIDYTEDTELHCFYDKQDGKYYRDDAEGANSGSLLREDAGMFLPWGDGTDQRFVHGRWHIAGSVLIEWKGSHYLGGVDDNNYFLSKLPEKAEGVSDAYSILKPKMVRRAQIKGKRVYRQGEWFFVETGLDDKGLTEKLGVTQKHLRTLVTTEPLPHDQPSGNRHLVKQLQVHRYPNIEYELLCKGMVRHVSPFTSNKGEYISTGEHRTLRLGNEWFVPYKNTAVQSWSQGGGTD